MNIKRVVTYLFLLIILLIGLIYINFVSIYNFKNKELQLEQLKSKVKSCKNEDKEYGYSDILEYIAKYEEIKIDKINETVNNNVINANLTCFKDISYIGEALGFFKQKDNIRNINFIRIINNNEDGNGEIFMNIDFVKTK